MSICQSTIDRDVCQVHIDMIELAGERGESGWAGGVGPEVARSRRRLGKIRNTFPRGVAFRLLIDWGGLIHVCNVCCCKLTSEVEVSRLTVRRPSDGPEREKPAPSGTGSQIVGVAAPPVVILVQRACVGHRLVPGCDPR